MNWRTGSWAEKDRDCPSTPVRADQGTRSGFDRRRRGPWPSVQKNPRRTFRGFWTHSAFLKQHHQPLQAEVAPWPKGPRPKTPPPSISMHPASMLTLDQRSSTWTPEISRCISSGNLRTDELAFIPERRQTTDCQRNSWAYQEKASACLNPANPKISEPNRAGLGGMRRSKRPQLTIFQLYSNQQHWFPQKWNLIIRSCQSYLIRLKFWNRNISKIISILRVCDCNICSLIFFITP